ncbi:MAG TPA: enoyl-CoA hydratase-related protein, partial [Candidatus Eisenbacteria bacterium]
LVLAARGRAFCAGVDVRDHLPDRGAEMIRTFDHACALLLEIEAPVVAAIQGAALGGGAELALVCDLVWAADVATFGFPEIRLGVFPPVAAAALSGVIPAPRAAELVLTGRVVPAAEAERLGLVNRVVPAAELEAAVASLVEQLAALSPEALRVAKRALRLGRGRPDPRALEAAERIYLEERLEAADAVEGLNAFLEKRPPAWAKE